MWGKFIKGFATTHTHYFSHVCGCISLLTSRQGCGFNTIPSELGSVLPSQFHGWCSHMIRDSWLMRSHDQGFLCDIVRNWLHALSPASFTLLSFMQHILSAVFSTLKIAGKSCIFSNSNSFSWEFRGTKKIGECKCIVKIFGSLVTSRSSDDSTALNFLILHFCYSFWTR